LRRAVEHHRYRSELVSAADDREQRMDLFGSSSSSVAALTRADAVAFPSRMI
jgi:hypothetical protein